MADKITNVDNKTLEGVVKVSCAWRKWKVNQSDDESDNSDEGLHVLSTGATQAVIATSSSSGDSITVNNNKKHGVDVVYQRQTPDVDSLLREVAAKQSVNASLASRSTLPEKKLLVDKAANKYEGKPQRERVAVEGTAYDVETMEFPGELLRKDQVHSIRYNMRQNSNNIDKTKSTEKESLKERTKRQRLSGQSGIGDEFKTWRSEEEMKQRQQYD